MINRIYIILVLSSSKLQIGRTGNNSKFCESSKVPTPNSNKYFKKNVGQLPFLNGWIFHFLLLKINWGFSLEIVKSNKNGDGEKDRLNFE